MTRNRTAQTVDDLLSQARATLPDRPSPAEAFHAQASGALLIDIRGDDQRREDGLIPGAILLPRNSLEWRCDITSAWRHPAITRRDLRIILVCNQGYQSSLAAANLQQLGHAHATDLDGGFTAWAAAGLPVIAPAQPVKTRPAAVTGRVPRAGLARPARRRRPAPRRPAGPGPVDPQPRATCPLTPGITACLPALCMAGGCHAEVLGRGQHHPGRGLGGGPAVLRANRAHSVRGLRRSAGQLAAHRARRRTTLGRKRAVRVGRARPARRHLA